MPLINTNRSSLEITVRMRKRAGPTPARRGDLPAQNRSVSTYMQTETAAPKIKILNPLTGKRFLPNNMHAPASGTVTNRDSFPEPVHHPCTLLQNMVLESL
jgi:hypothetical protein